MPVFRLIVPDVEHSEIARTNKRKNNHFVSVLGYPLERLCCAERPPGTNTKREASVRNET